MTPTASRELSGERGTQAVAAARWQVAQFEQQYRNPDGTARSTQAAMVAQTRRRRSPPRQPLGKSAAADRARPHGRGSRPGTKAAVIGK